MADNIDLNAVNAKLAAARTKLILDKPFLGALVLRLPMIEANGDWCKTTATDARAFYFNAEYIDNLSLSQTQFMLAHEALHCALSHFARRQHRVKHRWDLACDFAINPILIDDGLEPPPDSLMMAEYKDMTAEEIYPLLDDNDNTDTLDQHLYDKDESGEESNQGDERKSSKSGQGGKTPDNTGEQQTEQQVDGTPNPQQDAKNKANSGTVVVPDDDGQPEPLSHQEKETLDVQWQQRLAGAAQQARQAGKLGDSIARLIQHLQQSKLPWRMLLAKYMTQLARDDFSYQRPSRREGAAIMPSLRSHQINIAIAVDTSGSIDDAEINEFLSEISGLKGQVRARITLLSCDAEIKGTPVTFEPWEDLDLDTEIKGGGGTDFRPVFDWLNEQNFLPDLLVYFTDAQGQFPDREPNYPVIWLLKGKKQPPWGQRIQLN